MSDLSSKLEVAKTAKAEGVDTATALDIFDMVRRQQQDVGKALPSGMDPERFIRMTLTEMRRTPKLALCDPATLLGAMMLAAQTGLEPGGPLGQSFLIPRWSGRRKVNEAQFQIGYKGLIALAGRSGFLIQSHTVRTGDGFEYAYGSDEYIWHQPAMNNDGLPILWWAIAHPLAGGKSPFRVIDRNEAEKARSAGKAGDKSPWMTGFYDAMAEKTAIIRLAGKLPLTTDVAYAIAADGAVVQAGVTVEEAAESAQAELEAGLPDDSDEAPTEASEEANG